MVQLKSGEDRELNLGDAHGIFVYIENEETPNWLSMTLTISDGVYIVPQGHKIVLMKPKNKEVDNAKR